YAQSNANGSLFGRADAGSTVVVEDPSTGVRREISVQADGTYRASQLPIGNYRVTMKRADGTETVREGVRVSVGTGTPVNFAGGGADATLGTISVTSNAINPIDVSSVESTTILSAERIEKIPVSRDTTSVALLAPGT
ncbi:MAG: carboxypeptidase regulatory-like domain-containing protein, partial [Xanthomonadales bacterium]|nr:carboxypeptidase regulatory-like domain-containing protein [Xanthomonadales bacterium]